MTRVLVLGATGRTGTAVLENLPAAVAATAALRVPEDADRLTACAASLAPTVVDIADTGSLRDAIGEAEVVVNAIRLREDIAERALIALHDRLVSAGAASQGASPLIVTVGGAGALTLPGGERFWRTPVFPTPTLARGRAHAALRDHLEAGRAGQAWTYLIPPPAYDPDGPATGRWEMIARSLDESSFTARAISYADFGAAVAEAALSRRTGTHLIASPR